MEYSKNLLPPKQILFVIGSLNRGGAEKHLCSLIQALAPKGFHIQLFILSETGSLVSEINHLDVKIHSPPNLVFLSSLPVIVRSFILAIISIYRLTSALLREKPDIVHMFLPASYILGSTVGFFFPKIVKVMSRRSLNNYQNKNILLKYYERFLHNFTSYIFANSSEVKLNLIKEGVQEVKIRLIPNGVKEFALRPEEKLKIRNSLCLEPNCFVFINVANLIEYKGHMDLLNALEIFSKQATTPFKLLLVGRDDGEKLKQQEYAKSLGIFESVIWLGEQRSPRDFISIADVGILASHQEGMSNALLEKMSAALPVIATNVGGNIDLVKHAENGFLVTPGSPVEMSNAMVSFYQNKKLRNKLGKSAEKSANSDFNFDKMIKLYTTAYSEILN